MSERAVTIRARHILVLLLLAVSALAAGSGAACAADRAGGTEPATLRVFAASSLTDTMTDVAAEFGERNGGVNVETHFAASSRLRAQIEEGAQADIFLSADPLQIDALATLLRTSSIQLFASNRMVVAVSESADDIQAVGDLAAPEMRIVIALPDVPAGRYARSIIDGLTELSGAEGLADAVYANIVSEETNVRAVLAKVQLGEVDAGFVYESDAAAANLRYLELPQPAGGIDYVAAILHESSQPDAAQMFMDFLLSSGGQVIMERHGFLAVSREVMSTPVAP